MTETAGPSGSRVGGAARGPAAGQDGGIAVATPPGSVAAVEDLHRTFIDADGHPIPVLRGLNLQVGSAETVAIVGPSGSGKSTLLHLMGGLDRPTAGAVELGGQCIDRLDDVELAALRNRYVGFVFQFHHLLRDFSALENVMIPQLVAGRSRGEAETRARELLEQVSLSDRLGHRPGKLSGGERQRVAVARALANQPPLLLADEPSGNLDVETSERLHDLLFGLMERHRSALVVVTHSRSLARRAGRVLRLTAGVLEAV